MTQYNPFHRVLRALGLHDLPAEIVVAGRRLRRVKTLKHDFFAATGLYEDAAGQVVLKLGRVADIVGLPGGWIGRWLTLREARFYERLSGLPGIPRYLGLWQTTLGRWRLVGLVHEFVPGHPLGRYERVGDRFFDQLRTMLAEMHGRGMAYVDLNKRENILVGDDGRPYLIDFQISYVDAAPARRSLGAGRSSPRSAPRKSVGETPPAGRLLRVLQGGDVYHFCKHKRRHRVDLCTPEELAAAVRRGAWGNVYRLLTRPLQRIRRGALRQLDPSHQSERTRLGGG